MEPYSSIKKIILFDHNKLINFNSKQIALWAFKIEISIVQNKVYNILQDSIRLDACTLIEITCFFTLPTKISFSRFASYFIFLAYV